ncbi:nuclear transport factor 2 family protein [Kordiimonas aquimaris]|uniref:nuclear transport factor 2 family protein n=1 Tax=Kordiimonas aquimaris TaxID=707591 RepID=UPI0021CF4865|nr:nuclear transport factor 2 family protein [Kordiimonas aquimaris]
MATQNNTDDFQMIINAALDYAYGVASKDWDRIKRAFDVPKAQMKLITGTPKDEKVYVMAIVDVWEKIWSPLPLSPNHIVEFLNISIQEGRLANVTMKNNGVFLDYLSLYKVGGKWKIYDKLARSLDGANIPEEKLISLFGQQE